MKVSVIIPAYNVSDYLECCIRSILSQTYKDVEAIIIDDGSVDKTPEVCNFLAKFDSRVKVYHKPNGGVSSARNLGIQTASGQYIMFVDGDDWIEKNCLEDMLCKLTQTNSDACTCQKYFRNNTIQIATTVYSDSSISANLIVQKHLRYGFVASPCLTMWKRECIKEILFNENIHTLEDWEYNFRCLTNIKSISILEKPYYHYRAVEGSASVSPLNNRKLSCLAIPRYVDDYIKENNLSFIGKTEYVSVFLVYHMLVIYSTQGSVDSSEIKLRNFARATLRKVVFSKDILYKHKFYLLLASIHPLFFKVLFRIKNKL